MSDPVFHLCLVQPLGYVHALGFVEPARHLRWQLRRLGLTVTMSKNRLRQDAINVVLGAHLGFDPEWCQRYTCIFLNLEQLGAGGATLPQAYLRLLRTQAVLDYDAANVAAYCEKPDEVPLLPQLFAPYLQSSDPPAQALEDRPIDLLFYGSLNPRRQAWLDAFEAAGQTVTCMPSPLYGAERDAWIRQAKAVLNIHFYDSSRFEQVRVAHCLSLGTPVVAEFQPESGCHAAFVDSVAWLDLAGIEAFVQTVFKTPDWYAWNALQLQHFQRFDALTDYADLVGFARGVASVRAQHAPQGPWVPTRMNIGSGRDYQTGWLNVDILARTEPDLVLDLSQPLNGVDLFQGLDGSAIRLAPDQLEEIRASHVLEHVPDLAALMSRCLDLLKVGGEMCIDVPYEHAPGAWQDPTHCRAMNENSWLYYTDWFWYLGWFEHRFQLEASQYLDVHNQACERAQAAAMRVRMKKVVTSAAERTTARMQQPQLRVPDDEPVAGLASGR